MRCCTLMLNMKENACNIETREAEVMHIKSHINRKQKPSKRRSTTEKKKRKICTELPFFPLGYCVITGSKHTDDLIPLRLTRLKCGDSHFR